MTTASRRRHSFPARSLDVPLKPLSVRRPPRPPADQKLVERVRREYSDLRGLSPTISQARKLFHLADDECLEIFAQLLREQFLDLGADQRYRLRRR
jgi:hypothetical protein